MGYHRETNHREKGVAAATTNNVKRNKKRPDAILLRNTVIKYTVTTLHCPEQQEHQVPRTTTHDIKITVSIQNTHFQTNKIYLSKLRCITDEK